MKEYFNQPNLQNIWLHLLSQLQLNKQNQNFLYHLQYVGFRRYNNDRKEQNKSAQQLLYNIYFSSQKNIQRINIIRFDNLGFQRMKDVFYGAVMALGICNCSDQQNNEFNQISDFEMNTLRRLIALNKSQENRRSAMDCYKNLKATSVSFQYLKQRIDNLQAEVPNLTNLESDLNMDYDINQEMRAYIQDLNINKTYFQLYLEQKHKEFQNRINRKCININVIFQSNFNSTLQALMEMKLIEYLFLKGELNDISSLVAFNRNEQRRNQLLQSIESSNDSATKILFAQFKTQIEYQINEIIKNLL